MHGFCDVKFKSLRTVALEHMKYESNLNEIWTILIVESLKRVLTLNIISSDTFCLPTSKVAVSFISYFTFVSQLKFEFCFVLIRSVRAIKVNKLIKTTLLQIKCHNLLFEEVTTILVIIQCNNSSLTKCSIILRKVYQEA